MNSNDKCDIKAPAKPKTNNNTGHKCVIPCFYRPFRYYLYLSLVIWLNKTIILLADDQGPG